MTTFFQNNKKWVHFWAIFGVSVLKKFMLNYSEIIHSPNLSQSEKSVTILGNVTFWGFTTQTSLWVATVLKKSWKVRFSHQKSSQKRTKWSISCWKWKFGSVKLLGTNGIFQRKLLSLKGSHYCIIYKQDSIFYFSC